MGLSSGLGAVGWWSAAICSPVITLRDRAMERNRQAGWLRDMERRAGGAEATEEAPEGREAGCAPAGPGSGGQAGRRDEAPSAREAAERPAPGAGRPGTGKPATAGGPKHKQSGARRRPRHSAEKEAGWSLLKRKWPQHLTKGASFFLRGSRYLTRERENSARSEGSGSPRQLQRPPEAAGHRPQSRSSSGPGLPPHGPRDPGRATPAACGKLAPPECSCPVSSIAALAPALRKCSQPCMLDQGPASL